VPGVSTDEHIEHLYLGLLARWNTNDALGYGGLFLHDGSMVGFDGSCVETAAAITDHLQSIFADHRTGEYVANVREVRELAPGVALLRAVAGMVPAGASDIKPELNAVQSLVAVETPHGWRVAHFQNTPAAFHGRPEDAEALTKELRALASRR
jgi:uncharacterized protein (TIGR02246 family)